MMLALKCQIQGKTYLVLIFFCIATQLDLALGQLSCFDTDNLCNFWARVGECQRNAIWMLPHCQLSCGKCRPEKPKAPPISFNKDLGPQGIIINPRVATRRFGFNSTNNNINNNRNNNNNNNINNINSRSSSEIPAAAAVQREVRTDQSFDNVVQQEVARNPGPDAQVRFGRIVNPNRDRNVATGNQPTQNVVPQVDANLVTNNRPAAPQPVSRLSVQSVTAPRALVPPTPPPFRPTPPPFGQRTNPGPVQSFRTDCNRLQSEQPEDLSEQMARSGLIVSAEANRNFLSVTSVKESNERANCVPRQGPVDCNRDMCYNLRFRSLDGTCNNFAHPLLGASFTSPMRHMRTMYDDGISAPVGTIRSHMPNSRDLSRNILSSTRMVLHTSANSMVMQWGQFIAHDLTKTTTIKKERCGSNTPCSLDEHQRQRSDTCSNVFINRFDPSANIFGCQGQSCCMHTTRTAPVCGTGHNTPKLQLNECTAFIDASTVYGSSIPDMLTLREGRTAFMRTETLNGFPFLPKKQPNSQEFLAGDDRANVFVGLTALHTLFVREHNRVARALQQLNPRWDGDRVFQEARKIVGAQQQIVTFKEWLPKILGTDFGRRIGVYRGYDSGVDPSLSIEFTTGIFRFGHGMIQEFYPRQDRTGNNIPQGGLAFLDGVNQPAKIFEGGIAAILRGLSSIANKLPQRVTASVTERLFGNKDLVATNIQRGRDNGIASYNDFREFCGFRRALVFGELADNILDQGSLRKLEGVYTDGPDSVDLFVGATLEDPQNSGMVGPTMSCVLGNQFKRLRDGDRFWWENPGVFTSAQRAELAKFNFARAFCDDAAHVNFVNKDFFLINNQVSCAAVPQFDLRAWQES